DLAHTPIRILRAGPISRSELEAVLGEPVELPTSHQEVVPGNVEVHYRPPHTPVHLVDPETLINVLQQQSPQPLALLTRGPLPGGLPLPVHWHHRALPTDKAGYASQLYQAL